jgi:hypothetical protein
LVQRAGSDAFLEGNQIDSPQGHFANFFGFFFSTVGSFIFIFFTLFLFLSLGVLHMFCSCVASTPPRRPKLRGCVPHIPSPPPLDLHPDMAPVPLPSKRPPRTLTSSFCVFLGTAVKSLDSLLVPQASLRRYACSPSTPPSFLTTTLLCLTSFSSFRRANQGQGFFGVKAVVVTKATGM